jgi:hypothetical protein
VEITSAASSSAPLDTSSAAPRPPAAPITGLIQKILARIFLQALHGFDVAHLPFCKDAENARTPYHRGAAASAARRTTSSVGILTHALPADPLKALPRSSEARECAVRAFHRKREVLEKMWVQRVHALDGRHLLLQLMIERDAVAPLLALYDWQNAQVVCVHPLYGCRALACIMWCAFFHVMNTWFRALGGKLQLVILPGKPFRSL